MTTKVQNKPYIPMSMAEGTARSQLSELITKLGKVGIEWQSTRDPQIYAKYFKIQKEIDDLNAQLDKIEQAAIISSRTKENSACR